MADWVAELQRTWPGKLELDCPMARHCTLRVGGLARVLAAPASIEELALLLQLLGSLEVPWHVIGRGSNLLVPDTGYAGVIILLSRNFAAISPRAAKGGGVASVRVAAGCGLMKLVNWCLSQSLSGLEFAAGIPGSVGGAVAMNAGAWGEEIAGRIEAVTLMDRKGRLATKAGRELAFSYRRLDLAGQVVVEAEFSLVPGCREEMEARCRDLLARRKEKQPQGLPSAGSFFKNPAAGPAAGKLIEEAGLKGRQIGGALISPKHANFLVNAGGATASDFLQLMGLVQAAVEKRSGIRLEPEVRILTVPVA